MIPIDEAKATEIARREIEAALKKIALPTIIEKLKREHNLETGQHSIPYERTTNKDIPGGYPSLDESALVPTDDLGEGVADVTKFLRGDREWMPIFLGARVYLSADQLNFTSGAWTTIQLNTEDYDIGANFDVSLYKFIVPVTGYYDIMGQVFWGSVIADKRYGAGVFKGVTHIAGGLTHASHADNITVSCRDIIYLTAGDELYLKGYNDSGVNTCGVISGPYCSTFLTVRLINI